MESIERARRATWLARAGTAAAMTSALALGTAGAARGLVAAVSRPAVGAPAVSTPAVSPFDPPIAATGQPARSRTAESILSIIGVAATLALGARELAKQWPATDRA